MRRERKKSYGSQTAFLDMMLNVLAVFVFLFVVALTQVKDENPSKKVTDQAKAEFIITVTWPESIDDDIDTYVEDPSGRLVCFRRREDGLMHIDRDDLGYSNDRILTPTGWVIYKENREIVTIRGIIPGEYIVNVHAYAKRKPGTTPITVKVEKINPYQLVTQVDVNLDTMWQEKTAFRFTLNKEGDVVSINDIQKSLIASQAGNEQPNDNIFPEGQAPENQNQGEEP